MDLSLVPAPAASAPPAPPPASRTAGKTAAGRADDFDALLDRAAAEDADGDEDESAVPATVVAPTDEQPAPDAPARPSAKGETTKPAAIAGESTAPSLDARVPVAAGLIEEVPAVPLEPPETAGTPTEPSQSKPAEQATTSAADTSAPAQAVRGMPTPPAAVPAPVPEAPIPGLQADAGAASDSQAPVASPPPPAPAIGPTQSAPEPAAATRKANEVKRPDGAPTARADRSAAEALLRRALEGAGAPPVQASEATQAPDRSATPPQDGATHVDVTSPAVVQRPRVEPLDTSQAESPAPASSAATIKIAIEAFARAEGEAGEGSRREFSEQGGAEPRSASRLATAAMFAEGASASSAVIDRAVDLMAADALADTGNAATDVAPNELPDLMPQFVKGIQMHWRGALGDARLELQPAHLGPVTVNLQVGPDGVQATLASDSALVRGWLEAHEADLRHGLAGQGLHLASLTVTADPQEQRRRQPPQQQAPPNERRNPDAPPENWTETSQRYFT